jgi:hypothetical protein
MKALVVIAGASLVAAVVGISVVPFPRIRF